MSKDLPKLTIKPKEDFPLSDTLGAATFECLSIQLDDVEVRGLRGLDVSLDLDELNIISMTFAAEVEIDLEGVIELVAKAKSVKAGDKLIKLQGGDGM